MKIALKTGKTLKITLTTVFNDQYSNPRRDNICAMIVKPTQPERFQKYWSLTAVVLRSPLQQRRSHTLSRVSLCSLLLG